MEVLPLQKLQELLQNFILKWLKIQLTNNM